MMEFSLIESAIVALGVLFGALDVDDNPKAPTGAAVASYAPDQADYVVYLDVKAVLPHAKRALDSLGTDETLRGQPTVRRFVDEALVSMDGALGLVKKQVGVDLVNDLGWIAGWVALPKDPDGTPKFLVVVSGTFPADIVERIGLAFGAPVPTRNGRPFLDLGGYALAGSQSGDVLFGDTELVEARVAARPPKPEASSLMGRTAALFSERPFFVLGSAPGEAVRTLIARRIGSGAPFITSFLAGHDFLGLAIHKKGLRWSWVSPDLAGVASAKLASEGVIELLRAGQLGTRGLVRLVLVSLRSYVDESVAQAIVANTDKVLKLIVDNTGDGRFDAKIDVRQKDRTVDVRATAESFKRVLPLGAILPFVGAGLWFGVAREAPARYEVQQPLAPTQPGL